MKMNRGMVILFQHYFLFWFGVTSATSEINLLTPSHIIASHGGPMTNLAQDIPMEQKLILKDLSLGLRLSLLKDFLTNKTEKNEKTEKTAKQEDGVRQVNVQALVMPAARRDDARNTDLENEDNNMKMKLFRLMYETVRDSDLKVKRAELIKRSYANSSAFEVGYLLGDITDKFNIMSDIALTLKRLYHEWKPLEHINAYEQIANLGIDVGHIVDMIKGVEKRLRDGNDKKDGSNGSGGGNTSPDPDYFEIPGRRK